MATIRKRRTGWQVHVRRANHPAVSKTFRLKADAEVWARRTEAEIDGQLEPGEQLLVRALTVRHLLEKYQREVTSAGKSKRQETAIIKQLLQEDFVDRPILKLSPADLSAFRDRRLSQVKPATVVRQLSVLQNAFNVAIRDWGWALKSNPRRDLCSCIGPTARSCSSCGLRFFFRCGNYTARPFEGSRLQNKANR
tara:strand:- start:372 stop:956 length:585 start_codon:yes stop_codon:yes gene_type:complete